MTIELSSGLQAIAIDVLHLILKPAEEHDVSDSEGRRIPWSERVDEREWTRRFRLQMRKARRTDTVDVVLTRNSGRLGVLFWINAYLDRAGVPSVTEDHPEARALIDWVIAEYETGVVDPIPVEELEQRALVLLDESPVQT